MSNVYKFLAGLAVAASFAGGAAAQPAGGNYPAIDESSIKIERIAGTGANAQVLPAVTADRGIIDNISVIANLMEKIFGIIEANQPVVNIAVNYANAVPLGITHWTQLQGWSKPAVQNYSFTANGAFGSQALKVDYQVHWIYGGNYQGKGKFLTGVTIEPISVYTAWGYKVSLTAEIPDSTVVNVGTQDEPVAAMQVILKWIIHTSGKDIQQKAIYYVQGDGSMQEIGTPFENAARASNAAQLERVTKNIEAARFN